LRQQVLYCFDMYCVGIQADHFTHKQMHELGLKTNQTIVYAAWHSSPEYRVFPTGSLLSRNEEYPCGLVIVDEKGKPTPWKDN
jgi:hypothetical protein